MFEGFAPSIIDTGEATIRVRHGGSGPPLVLLHGHTETHVMWYKLAPLPYGRLSGTCSLGAAHIR
jgi:haloacetate dehalogenase